MKIQQTPPTNPNDYPLTDYEKKRMAECLETAVTAHNNGNFSFVRYWIDRVGEVLEPYEKQP